MTILEIKNLSAGYNDLTVLKAVNLRLEKGTITVLMGPNGAGKSTVFKSIYGNTNIIGGEIFFKGKKVDTSSPHELLKMGIALVPQGRVNFGALTVRENLQMGARLVRSNKPEFEDRLVRVFSQFPALKNKENEFAFSLSGGQQQMLAIARALMGAPELLLLDEPSLGLSPKLVKEMFFHIKNIRDTFGTTILIIEHNLKSLMNVADYGCVLVQGEVILHGSCAVLKNAEVMREIFVGKFD